MLLGRVRRPSIASLEALEMERSSPKIIKDDHLSVYESTLMKLKEGSQRCQTLNQTDAMSTDVSCVTATDSTESSSAGCLSTGSFNFVGEETNSGSSPSEQRNKTPSVLYLFSRYKSLKSDPRSSDDKVVLMETECSSASASPSSSNSELTTGQVLQISEECFDSGMYKYQETSLAQQ
ncbi:OLC1v1013572C1 [Oldenlandia corymbosa var. corymbosa]|uniref:OLC1v1013572C1 n=1 Tax=Oldenlandia corymbosa var. corymbosa TaxID=529605 RepID=A0AAV1DYV1_OLDCO|nr:OLC1v1013572C1 [Oldenlandia corymbosa var. corymbosa]